MHNAHNSLYNSYSETLINELYLMRILLIEDDLKIQTFVKKGFTEAGHAVDVADNGEDGLHLATTEKFDVLVIDRMLPKLDGLSIVTTLRGTGNSTGVLILSALGDVDDRVVGFRSGGDDYLIKPFAFVELLARVEALGKRTAGGNSSMQSILRVGEIELDLLSRQAKKNGESIELGKREFQIFEYLLKFKGQLVTRTMLLEGVWNYNFDPQTGIIDVHICRLRNKLGDSNNTIIKTVRGAGFIIEESY